MKKALLWLALAVMGLVSFVCRFTGNFFAGIFAAGIFALTVPVADWQAYISGYVKGHAKKVLTIALTVLFVLSIIINISMLESAPSVDVPATNETISTASTSAQAITVTTSKTTKTTATSVITTTIVTTKVTTTTTTTIATTTTTAHIHSFSQADCTSAAFCSECGATQGEALGHSWEEATCYSPKRCSKCGETSGSAVGHSYSNGKCSVCGADDPNYTSEKLVWIPTNGGECYHKKSTCSKMIDPEQVTESEAIARNFKRCGICKP